MFGKVADTSLISADTSSNLVDVSVDKSSILADTSSILFDIDFISFSSLINWFIRGSNQNLRPASEVSSFNRGSVSRNRGSVSRNRGSADPNRLSTIQVVQRCDSHSRRWLVSPFPQVSSS